MLPWDAARHRRHRRLYLTTVFILHGLVQFRVACLRAGLGEVSAIQDLTRALASSAIRLGGGVRLRRRERIWLVAIEDQLDMAAAELDERG